MYITIFVEFFEQNDFHNELSDNETTCECVLRMVAPF